MPKQFELLVECEYHSRKALENKYFVIAGDRAEADEELEICVGYDPSIKEWRLIRLVEVSDIEADSHLAHKYREQGPFTVYEADYDLWRRFLDNNG
jgi:hypothetical protein